MESPCQEVQNQDLKARLPQHNLCISEVPITLREAHRQPFINQALLLCVWLWLGWAEQSGWLLPFSVGDTVWMTGCKLGPRGWDQSEANSAGSHARGRSDSE